MCNWIAYPTLFIGRPKVSIKTIQNMYRRKEAISMMTAQDYPSGLVVDQSGIDVCLVGDSLAMVSLGFDSTNPLTVEVKKLVYFIWQIIIFINNVYFNPGHVASLSCSR